MQHRGEVDVSPQDTFTAATSISEPNSYSTDEHLVRNASITEAATTSSQADPSLTSTSLLTDESSVPCMKSISLEYFVWLVNRLFRRTADDNSFVPGFTAVRSSLADLNFHETTKVLT